MSELFRLTDTALGVLQDGINERIYFGCTEIHFCSFGLMRDYHSFVPDLVLLTVIVL